MLRWKGSKYATNMANLAISPPASSVTLYQVVLILRLVCLFLPEAEGTHGFVSQERYDRYGAGVERTFQLLVDKVVGEVDLAGILAGVAVEDTADAGPVDGAETHRTWFA